MKRDELYAKYIGVMNINAVLKQQNAELLEALKEVRDWCDTSDDGDPIEMDYIFQPPWYQKLRIIIAKAEGKT